MSAQPVDVLAVMDRAQSLCAQVNPGGPNPTADALIEARAAVAELVEADHAFDKAQRAWDDGRFSDWDGVTESQRRSIAAEYEDATMRRIAALARLQGGGLHEYQRGAVEKISASSGRIDMPSGAGKAIDADETRAQGGQS